MKGPHHDLLGFLRSKTGRVGPFSLHCARLLSHRVLVHLVSNVLIEALLFLPDHFVLRRTDILVCFDPLKMLSHDRFVHIFLFGDFFFVALQGLPPGVTLGRIAVLDDSMILLRADIATVVQLFDLAGDKRGISDQTIAAKVDVTVDGGSHHGA